jgi:hypothetical protein
MREYIHSCHDAGDYQQEELKTTKLYNNLEGKIGVVRTEQR